MMGPQAAKFIYEHAFLPPKLPQTDHEDSGTNDLLEEIAQAARDFSRCLSPNDPSFDTWVQLARSIPTWINLYDGGTPCSYTIIRSLQTMREDDILLFYVKPQNATIVVRNRSTGAIFECFEVLPKTEAVLSAKDALLRQFPARAVFLPKETFADESFTQELGNAIHKLSIETLKLAMETSKKMNITVAEERQPPHPRAVSEWLFGLLGSRGKATSSPVICKRTHDDVCWKDAQVPWRRSGVWLSARVVLQLVLRNADLAGESYLCHYKNFMLFLLSRLAANISATQKSSDVLHILRVKLARRNAKLRSSTFEFVQDKVTQTLAGINDLMRTQWTQVMDSSKVVLPTVPVKEVTDQLSMKKSGPSLRKIWERSQQSFSYSSTSYTPPSSNRVSLPKHILPRPDTFQSSGDRLFALVDFERWIEAHLDEWLELRKPNSSTCGDLARLIETYYEVAKAKYDGHVERISIMFLTLAEMWVALDKAATETHPLLLDFPPEVPKTYFAPLVLNTQAELERLSRIEHHIAERQSRCKSNCPSLFSDPSKGCFAVRFYDQSQDLQRLRLIIEADADIARNIKRKEWDSKKKEFDSKMKEVESMKCGVWIPRGTDRFGRAYVGQPRHHNKCWKCAKEKEANNMGITKHEWPLPDSDMMCKAVVFELGAPDAITYWRDITFFIIQGVGRSAVTRGPLCKQVLLRYPPLENYVYRKGLRITLASAVKSILQSHYIKGLLSLDEVFVSNGLQPKMHDTKDPSVWTASQKGRVSLQRYCVSKLPNPLNDSLGSLVNFTTHSQNSVIAKQSRCPPEMGTHDFVLFGSLRSGTRLQWLNILGALMSTEMDINSPVTASLFVHAMSQVGAPGGNVSSFLRESQSVLGSVAFSRSLLKALYQSFSKIQANWKEVTAAGVLLRLCLKIWSVSSHVQIKRHCMRLISRIRKSSLAWIRQLAKLHTDQKSRHDGGVALKDLSRQTLNAALLARQAYALDEETQEQLFSDNETVADYVEASIYLHSHRDACPVEGDTNSHRDACPVDADTKMKTDLLNDAYLARSRERFIHISLDQDGGITAGILRFWPTATFTSKWKVVHQNDSSWLQNSTAAKVVHYNIVTGSLLVSGRALSRLPAEYCETAIYRSIFGELELDVFASDHDDMEYMSKKSFCGHKVYFGRRKDELLIRSQADGVTFEAVLSDIFLGDLPHSVVKTAVPWMSLDDGRVVFRPKQRPWTSTDRDWTLFVDVKGRATISMRAEQAYLIDRESGVGRAICKMFAPFEHYDHLVITFHDTKIQIKLPRFHLTFFVDHMGGVKCNELSASIDRSQDIGTLYGLESRLTLHTRTQRIVLIPNGEVKITRTPFHVAVKIEPRDSDSLTFSQYAIDARLGQLISADLDSHLYKSYLHAITSFPEPDPLTGRSGTEECLFGLSETICRTSVPLSERAQQSLKLISGLSPQRQYYPPHLRAMQSTTFNESLPVVSQRDIFFGTAHELVIHNLRASSLFDAEITLPSYVGDFGLLERAHKSNQHLYPSEFGVAMQKVLEDRAYSSRDRTVSLNQEISATLGALVHAWPSTFDVYHNLKSMVLGWATISGFGEDFSAASFSKLLGQDLKDHFASLVTFCTTTSSKEKLVFILSLMAFGSPEVVPKLRTLLAFAISSKLQELPAPEHDTYDLRQGCAVNQKEVLILLSECEKEFASETDGDSDQEETARRLHNEEVQEQKELILEAVHSAWPDDAVRLPHKRKITHYDISKLKDLLNGRFSSWYKNYVFLQQLQAFDDELADFNSPWSGPATFDAVLEETRAAPPRAENTHFTLLDLMAFAPVTESDFSEHQPTRLDHNLAKSISSVESHRMIDANQARHSLEELEEMVEELGQDLRPDVRDYGQFLGSSVEAMKLNTDAERPNMKVPEISVLDNKSKLVRDRVSYIISRITKLLHPPLEAERALVDARIWPQVSELTLLQLLSAANRDKLPDCWKRVLIDFAKEITALQRMERMQKYLEAEDYFALNNELANPAHDAWLPEEWPDWLLLEIQNNILIRPVQIRVAKELIKAEDGVVLLGMGEGKTAVIVPLVVTALANSTQLVRVVVLKPLAHEMLRLLSRSLSGLVGRTVFYLPFSRQTRLTHETPELLMGLYQDCLDRGGVLLTLPEHLNSFRLIGADKLSPETRKLAEDLIRLQHWLDQHARDVIDESDEILNQNYELVYTSGQASLLSGAPDRWTVTLDILDVVHRNASNLRNKLPAGIEVESRGQGAFPHIRILNDEGACALAELVAQAVVDGKLPSLPLGSCNEDVLQAVRSFLLSVDLDDSQFLLVSEHFQGSVKLDLLYVVRGLISYQILSHCLRKRWLVNYGLDRTRTLSAVPYRAKSIPSPSAEFAQPETGIILTALSFYYTGLLPSELRRCLFILLKTPDPSDRYSRWVAHSTLPNRYRQASSINLDDGSCTEEIYKHLRNNSEVIKFFLQFAVYPSVAKEFQHKLATSAWDLCRQDSVITTGFSGTCDSKIPIIQKDLQDLKHITASTLRTLLRFENEKYYCASSAGHRLSTEELLRFIVSHGQTDVIIDVGAQMLEANLEIASMWLKLCEDKNKMGVVYFSENDEKMVMNRDGSVEPLVSSVFKDEIRSCLIFLDEFHTRGTDFSLPDNFRAAVLLGPGLLKDNLAQACMRMRKLAVSQCVRYYAPPEVDQSIKSTLQDPSEEITSSHVVRWAIQQSCATLKKQGPLYATRGLLHSRRRVASNRHILPTGDIVDSDTYLQVLRERESRPVSEMYRVGEKHRKELPFEPSLEERSDSVFKDLLAQFERADLKDFEGSGIIEEQEREILHEVEEERELQRPKEVSPAVPSVCEMLLRLIRGSTLPLDALDVAGLPSAFKILDQTRLTHRYNIREFPTHVRATPDFFRTIQDVSSSDDFLRPVQWILTAKTFEPPIIISPHEANHLIPEILESKHATLVLYQARVSRGMQPFDGMDVYQIPDGSDRVAISSPAIAMLNLVAGQLYFSTFDHYKQLCELIGLWDGERPLIKRQVDNENFVSPACRKANGWTGCEFRTSPVSLFKAFIGMRRLGIEWSHTHMGRILSGRTLRREDFEDA